MKNLSSPARSNKGAAILIVVLFFVIISGTLLIGVASPVTNQIRNTSEFLKSKQSYAVADAQAENTLYRLNAGKADAPSTLTILGATATANMTDVGDTKEIELDGTYDQFKRFLKTTFRQDSGVAFNYGLQAGVGGIQMEGSSYIVGNVYSNGSIVGNGGPGWYTTYVTGGVTIANISDPTAHIENTTSAGDDSLAFGLVNANQDIAESFVYSTSTPITEIELYVKKLNNSTPNANIKIVNNAAGVPGSTVLASGALNSSLVTTNFAYVPVAITTATSLVSGTTYWIVVDNSGNNANYYTVGTNNSTYSGATKMGRLGTSWTNWATTTADMKFRIYVGGNVGSVDGMGVGTSGTGDLWANTVTDTTVTGSLYCQSGSGNNKVCNTTRADAPPTNMPISQGNIDAWKDEAVAGGATSSIKIDGVKVKTMGPIKINGNLEVEGSGRLNITGPIHVTGFIKVQGDGKIYVASSMGTASGVLVADGTVALEGSGGIYGSGTAGSYVVVITTSTCPWAPNCSGGSTALKISGAAGSVVLSAPDGMVELEGSVGIKALAAKKLKMSGTSHIIYETGLASMDFTSGPSGAWSIDTWNEVEEN